MNIRRILEPLQWPFISVLPGVAAFFFFTGGKVLRPTYTEWLMESDAATHLLGWQFFRHSEFFQWPLGANPDYGMGLSSSIVFTDAIPLLAFLFKPLSPVLPDPFQYTGLWILTCFGLQSFFACKLLSHFTKDKLLTLAGSLFFTIAPIYLLRIPGHFSLAGHWILLAGLYLYFSAEFSARRWMALLATSALIHPYLLAMALSIWLADFAQRSWLKQFTIPKAAGYFFALGAGVFLVMWAAGYFLPGTGFDETGFGYYRMNLLSLVDSEGIWSRLLRDQKGGAGDYEGFNYLGLGMIGLGAAAGYKFLSSIKITSYARIIPLVVLSGGLFLYAISNHVAIGGQELFVYELPPATELLTSTFRVSGRVFWPVYYLIFLAILYLLFTRFNRRDAIAMCLIALFIQAVDSTPAWGMIRAKLAHPISWASPMTSPAWEDIANQYSKVILVPPGNAPANWIALSQFASMHRMAINAGYFARLSPGRVSDEKERLRASIMNNGLNPDSLYIFENDELWKLVSRQVLHPDIAGVLDGFRIVAPNLGNCITCSSDTVSRISVEPGQNFSPE